jgi:hypothetical protein
VSLVRAVTRAQETLAERKAARRAEREALARGEVPDSLKNWRNYSKKEDENGARCAGSAFSAVAAVQFLRPWLRGPCIMPVTCRPPLTRTSASALHCACA